MQKTATNTGQGNGRPFGHPLSQQSGGVCVLRLDNFKNQQDICVFITSKCISTTHIRTLGLGCACRCGCERILDSIAWISSLSPLSAVSLCIFLLHISLTCHCTQLKSLCRGVLCLTLQRTVSLARMS